MNWEPMENGVLKALRVGDPVRVAFPGDISGPKNEAVSRYRDAIVTEPWDSISKRVLVELVDSKGILTLTSRFGLLVPVEQGMSQRKQYVNGRRR